MEENTNNYVKQLVQSVQSYMSELEVEFDVRRGGNDGGKDFGCDFEKVETEMDSVPFIKELLSQPGLRVFFSDNDPIDEDPISVARQISLLESEIQYAPPNDTMDKKVAAINYTRLLARQTGLKIRTETIGSRRHSIMKNWKERVFIFTRDMNDGNWFNETKAEGEIGHKDVDAVIKSLGNIKRFLELLTDKENSSSCLTKEKCRAFFLVIAFPALLELKETYLIIRFLLELSQELDNLPELICDACKGQPLILLLVGSLLSTKQRAYDTWFRVKDDLGEMIVPDNRSTNNHIQRIVSYCFRDLPDFLQQCFLFLACYPTDYKIPARSLTELWIAEQFVTTEEGETIEESANKYLKQLLQRSLVSVSKKSIIGTIKYCRVHRSIHKFVTEQSREEEFLLTNPDQNEMDHVCSRVAFRNADKKQYTDMKDNVIWASSFLAFDIDWHYFRTANYHSVLELRKSAILTTTLSDTRHLRYLGLRGSNISELPKDIGNNNLLQTLDVRDTGIKTLPESLWNIPTLRNVYVNPSPQILGPPSTKNISVDLQILKTVVVPQSWLANFPHFLINLRKLALSNKDDLLWKTISILLSRMVNLLSMEIVGNILPSEFVDTRAFPNLETVKSITFVGEWSYRKLPIDNVKFPTNLTKLTLTNSGLKLDPMPTLERLQALKFLSLQDEAYIGEQMVCTSSGFQKLQFLKLKKLHNLNNWEVKEGAMSQLTTLRVVQCRKLDHLLICLLLLLI